MVYIQEQLFSGILRRRDGRFINPLPLPQLLGLLHPYYISTPEIKKVNTPSNF
jgi:hypothetical protein